MALSGKVARPCFICAVAVALGLLCTSAIAAPLLPNTAQWRADIPTIPSEWAPLFAPGYETGVGWSPGEVVDQVQISREAAGPLVSTVTTTVYKLNDGSYIFDYVIDRSAFPTGSGAISFASLSGAGWQDVLISDMRVGPVGSSENGDPDAEWVDGTPAYVARDAQSGTPFWRYRAPILNGLLGTLIGPGDTSAHIWFRTNAVGSAPGFMSLSTDDGMNAVVEVLVPMVPEPTSLILVGAASLLFARRRNRVR